MPEGHLVYVSELMLPDTDILSVCLQQGEAGKPGRPGERGAAGPQVSDLHLGQRSGGGQPKMNPILAFM